MNFSTKKTTIALSLLLGLAACNGSSNDHMPTPTPTPTPAPTPVTVSYEVTVTNLTQGQPLSPIAVILHDAGNFWEIGQATSVALEKLAESGSNTDFLALNGVAASASGEGLLMPGISETINVSIEDDTSAMLTVAAMLGKTNDGFTGLNAVSLADLQVGDSWSKTTFAYDAGTEANTESMATLGSAGGEGYNPMRDDLGFVTMHPGVVSVDDGLPTSALTQAQRFDNPVAMVRITRIE
jgi:hypothetical protein